MVLPTLEWKRSMLLHSQRLLGSMRTRHTWLWLSTGQSMGQPQMKISYRNYSSSLSCLRYAMLFIGHGWREMLHRHYFWPALAGFGPDLSPSQGTVCHGGLTKHLARLIIRCAQARAPMHWICSSQVSENTTTLSRYTAHPLRPETTQFFNLWNVAGAFLKPNGITV